MNELLFLSPRVPWPLDTGAKIRTGALLRAVAGSFPVHYAGFLQPELPEAEARRHLAHCRGGATLFPERATSWAARIALGLRTLPAREPITIAKYRDGRLREFVRRWAREHPGGLLHCDHLHMATYIDAAPGLRRALDEHNVESRILERLTERQRALSPLRFYMGLQARRMRACEARLVSQAERVFAVSEGDAADLATLAGWTEAESIKSIVVIPNGVDLDYFKFERGGAAPAADSRERRMVFVGSMNWLPNQDAVRYFVLEILPLLKETRAEGEAVGWHLDIVGQSPPPSVRALAGDAVRVTGTVDDVRPYVRGAGIFIVPLRIGGGSRLKILEAFAMGIPVVSTAIGCEGLGAEHARHLLVADTPREFAAAIERLRVDPALGEALAREARQFVERGFGWPAIGGQLVAQYMALNGNDPVAD